MFFWSLFFQSCTGKLFWDSDVGYSDGEGPGYWAIPVLVSQAQTDYNKGFRIGEAVAFFDNCATPTTVGGERKPNNSDWQKGYEAGLKAGKIQADNEEECQRTKKEDPFNYKSRRHEFIKEGDYPIKKRRGFIESKRNLSYRKCICKTQRMCVVKKWCFFEIYSKKACNNKRCLVISKFQTAMEGVKTYEYQL